MRIRRCGVVGRCEVVLTGDSFNIIWTDPSPYSTITAETSENCPGLDS